MMMQQIQQLQKTVMQLQLQTGSGSAGFGGSAENSNGGGMGGGYSSFGGNTPGTQGHSNYRSWSSQGKGEAKEEGGESRTWSNKGEGEVINAEEQKVLLVSNIPPNLANPDSLFYAFEKFGSVDRVKILHNKRNTALIQMSQPEEAMRALNEQDRLNRVGTEIYVNFSSKFKEIKVHEPGSMFDDGLTKDYTGQFPSHQQPQRQNNFNMGMGQNFDSAKLKKAQGNSKADNQKTAAAGLKSKCSVCMALMPDPKTYRQHFENKHPKNPIPQELQAV